MRARSRFRRHIALADSLIAPLALFVAFYMASFILLVWLRFPFVQWTGLLSVTIATTAVVMFWEHGSWPLGLFVPPRLAVSDFALGSLWGSLLIGACALLIVALSDVRHARGTGFPWFEFFAVFVPAAVHEELLFRGYFFQKLHRRSRTFALLFVAALFAALHAGNPAVTYIALTNIFIGGVLLGVAWERYERLWFPIGLHLAWNIVSGPILGHEVSGYDSLATVFVAIDRGAPWLTGGRFGIEGSLVMTFTEIAGVALLAWSNARRRSHPNMIAAPFVDRRAKESQ